MIELRIFTNMLILAIVLTMLVAGIVFTFAIITMPGIQKLNDREFIRAFQVMDSIIQDNHPLFVLTWAGSVVALLIAIGLGFRHLEGIPQWLLIGATAIYIIGVQLPTFVVNIPLNNQLQTLNVDTMEAAELSTARETFEGRWNRWNQNRTVVAIAVSVILLIVLLML